ncbi:hypothetical protein LRP88_12063 [Fusarium phalaenopsidis]
MTSRFSYGVSGTCGYSGSYGYSYGALTSQQAAHSREASRHSALSHPSYPPSRYDPQTRQFQYSSSVPKDIKFPGLVQSKVVAVKSKNNDMSWHRISQSMGLAKTRERDRLEEKLPGPTVLKVKKKKKKWKWWWGKKKEKDLVEPEHHDVYNASKNKEPEMMVRPESRPGMLEWLGGESLPVQSPQALKELFEREY